jgi:hypothetical protein
VQFLLPATCDCSDLIGTPYRLGADGSDGHIDCIHLVYTVLERYDIPTPELQQSWYTDSQTTVLRALLSWGNRVDDPTYNGEVVLIPQHSWAFAVTWQTGILYINPHLSQVAWSTPRMFKKLHYFRLKSS